MRPPLPAAVEVSCEVFSNMGKLAPFHPRTYPQDLTTDFVNTLYPTLHHHY
jgi:hypothetical protein